MLARDVERALKEYCIRLINRIAPQTKLGVWVAAETVDANLSRVISGGDTYRYVPKLSGVSPSAGQQVFMVKGLGTPLIIVGVVVGDITLATS